MAKINLSIPDELKAQMDALPGRQWSQVAARAFQNEVKLQTLKGENMSEALERLRASKQQVADEDRAVGAEIGKEWAMTKATWKDLRAVAGVAEEADKWPDADLLTFDGLWKTLKNIDWDDEDVLALFGHEKNDPPPSDELAEGFIEGARQVKDEV
jgi:uncharacterized protein YukE